MAVDISKENPLIFLITHGIIRIGCISYNVKKCNKKQSKMVDK